MADRGDGLARLGEILDQSDGAVFHAQEVGIDLAAGQKQRVIAFAAADFVQGLVDLDAVTPIVFVPTLDLAAFEADDGGFDAHLLQIGLGLRQFRLFETVGGEDEYAFCHESVSVSSCYRTYAWGKQGVPRF